MHDASVPKTTGKSLDEWFEVLDERGGRALSHQKTARLRHEDHSVPGWWCQRLTVEYEKHIGRRETGQRQSGLYTTTASRTLPGDDGRGPRPLARAASGGRRRTRVRRRALRGRAEDQPDRTWATGAWGA